MVDPAAPRRRPVVERIGRWLGIVALAASITFVGERLWRLDWSMLAPYASWGFVGALVAALLMFAAADRSLAAAWRVLVDPDRRQASDDMARIYARGVLMKYLPGSVFQYISRQFDGARTGIEQKLLARSIVGEVGLHLVSSLTVAAICLIADHHPTAAIGAAGIIVIAFLAPKRPFLNALALQILAFGGFALAAMLVGAAVLPPSTSLTHFAALFLLAWLVGFVVPIAPGGIGVREAALLVLAGTTAPPAALMAAALALRASSITGDVAYGLFTLRPAIGRLLPRNP